MPFTHKVKIVDFETSRGSEATVTPGWVAKDASPPQLGERIYIFSDDSSAGAKDGGLRARGSILSAQGVGDGWRLHILFDGARVVTPLFNAQLDDFKKRGNDDPGPFKSEILTEIAELRRKTTQQPLHWISNESATWLDLYHFEPRG
jgi:hypothetical protein